MATQLTPFGRALVMVCGLTIVGSTVYRYGLLETLIPRAKERGPVVPAKIDLPDAPGAGGAFTAAVVPIADPGTGAGCADKPEVRVLVWAWNAQMGMLYATGGPQATQGSLMCGHGVNLHVVRQDDVSRMQADLVAFASALEHGSAQPTTGAHFVSIMGDGSATFLKGVNDTLEKLGPEYRAKVVGSAGYSRGEDKFMGPSAWKQQPARSAGGLVAGVLRDGDWNIAQKWLGDNGLCNNPDESTWDPACLNWVNASTYIDASEKYVAGYCETRPVVSKGHRTGESRKICVDGVVTWTPGDVIVAEKKGGLVSIVSTREYSSQMPNVLIGIDRWMQDNRATVEGLLAATFEGGDQVKANERAFRKAAAVSADVYQEQGADAAYWAKYFRVVKQPDRSGQMVELGGSSVNNLADNLMLFGLVPGSANLFAATYGVFGSLVVAQYPDLVPRIDPVSRVLDTSYVQAVAQGSVVATPADLPRFDQAQPVRTVVSRKAWQIEFESGKASFTPAAESQLQRLSADLLVASSTAVEVHGHTDSQGSADTNMALSEARAFAVKHWLETQSPVNFPSARLRVFAHGQTNPVSPNDTADGRAHNRRVEIVLGTTGTEMTTRAVFLPNQSVSTAAMGILVAGQVTAFVVCWSLSATPILPRPLEVANALGHLWLEQGLGRELLVSFVVNAEALLITTVLSLGLCYLTVVPFFRPLAGAVARGRFLGLMGLTFLFTLILGGGRPLKVALLVFGTSVFFVTSMADVIASIPREQFDHARTLRMGEWRVVWEVVVLGTADKALDVVRQNAAIGWMMLTMVEGIARADGGVGRMLIDQNKHFRLPDVFAIQLLILMVGVSQDWALGAARRALFPWADLTRERR